jgi:excisionase family DNA binding protein
VEDIFERFLSVKEASERSGISQNQIRYLLAQGEIRGVKKGRDWLVEIASVDQYAATQGWHRARRKKQLK